MTRPASNDAGADLEFGRDGAIAVLTLNRPAKLNTVTPAMGLRLLALADEINADKSVRVVMLRGAGERAFCAGSDVTALDGYGSNWDLRNRADYVRALFRIRKPVVAVVRGWCIGGGLELALASDIRVADSSARFGAGEIKLGWMGGCGNTQLLPRIIGVGKATQMCLTGDPIAAEEAHRLGLVQELWPTEQLAANALELARRIAANAPIAVELTKHLMRVSQSTSLEMGLSYENDLFTYCFTTQDHLEGIAAFREKRPPRFRGE